jgi:hypothetical protein
VNDSLKAKNKRQEEGFTEVLNDISQIEENLAKIREQERIIRKAAAEDPENNPDAAERINRDINALVDLLRQNRQIVQNLNQKLKEAGSLNEKYKAMIESLTQQLQEKNEEIILLKEELENLDIAVEGLTEHVETLTEENLMKDQEIDAKTDALNTAYYVWGTKDELIDNNVITKEKGLSGYLLGEKKMSEDFNTGYFTKVDIRKIQSIPLMNQEIEILSTHPKGSYKLKLSPEDDDEVESLEITDPQKFWSVSKYLVIIVDD